MKPRIIALTARRAVVLIVAGYGALYAPGRRICCAGRAGDTRAPRPNLNSTSRARLLPSREYTQIEREPLQCQITSVISFRPVCRESYSGFPGSSCLPPSSSSYSTSSGAVRRHLCRPMRAAARGPRRNIRLFDSLEVE
jgi:hypothetical protein